jgi:hypothetical protein
MSLVIAQKQDEHAFQPSQDSIIFLTSNHLCLQTTPITTASATRREIIDITGNGTNARNHFFSVVSRPHLLDRSQQKVRILTISNEKNPLPSPSPISCIVFSTSSVTLRLRLITRDVRIY